MSSAVFPDLPGLTWTITRTPIWKTLKQTVASGLENRVGLWSLPQWQWTLIYEFLRSSAAFGELQSLVGFFNARQGSYDTFLFRDPSDCSVTGQQIGIGDGTTASFQLVRSFGGFTEPVKEVNGTPVVYANGVAVSGWAVGNTGIVTFDSAPASGAVVSADINYYWRVRFVDDQYDFDNFMYQLWECKKLQLISVKS